MPYISCEEAHCDYPEFCMSDHWVPGLREKFLREQAESWDEHVDALRVTFREHMEDVRFVMENWDVLDDLTRFGLVSRGNDGVEMLVARHAYRLPTTLLEAMWWVVHFVSHEVYDDGSPAVVWVRRYADLTVEEEAGMTKEERLRELQRRLHAPWDWCDASHSRAQAVLVSDPGSFMSPHAQFFGSINAGSPLVEAVRITKERQAKADASWEAFKGVKRVRHESKIQRDLKIILDALFKKEFMP